MANAAMSLEASRMPTSQRHQWLRTRRHPWPQHRHRWPQCPRLRCRTATADPEDHLQRAHNKVAGAIQRLRHVSRKWRLLRKREVSQMDIRPRYHLW